MLIFFVILGVILLNHTPATQEQLAVLNSSFEEISFYKNNPEGWKTWVREGHAAEVTFHVDSEVAYEGKRSVKIVNLGYKDCCYCLKENIPVSLETECLYRIGGYMKCENVEGMATIKVFTVDTAGKKDWKAALAKTAGNHDWRFVSADFVLAPDILELGIQLELTGPGTAWFDVISLKKTEMDSLATLTYGGKTFLEVPSVPSKEMPTLSKKQEDRGYVAFVSQDPDGVFLSTVPQEREVKQTIEIFAAQNEYEPAPFGIYALRDLKNVRVLITDLINVKGNRIGKNAVDIRTVRYWPQRISWNSSTYYIIPELLEHKDAIDIARDNTQQFWLTVKVPEEAVPGSYTSKVSVIPDNAAPLQMTLKVSVWPFELKTPPNKIWGVYSDSRRWKRYSLEQIEAELRDMKAHGINSILLYPVSADQVFIRNEELEVDLSRIDAYMQLLKKVGFQGPIVLSIQGLDAILLKLLDRRGVEREEKFAEWFKRVVLQLSQSAEINEWPEVLFHVVDEPANHEEKKHQAKRFYQLLKEAGCKTFTTADVVFCNQVLDPWLDVRCYNLDFVAKTASQCADRVRETRESNDTFWWYGSGCYPGQEGKMSANRYLSGALFWKSGASGQWSWTFQRPQGDPFNDFDGTEKDACITYPGADRTGHVPTLQWEGIREGIDDARYIYTLEIYIDQALLSSDETVQARAREIRIELDDLIRDIPWLYESEYGNKEADELRLVIAQRITELMGSYRK